MSDSSAEIVQQIRVQFESILSSVQLTSGDPPSAYAMERRLVTNLLELGRLLFQCFFLSQHASLKSVRTITVGDIQFPLHSKKIRSLLSVFGTVSFARGYYYNRGAKQGHYALDAQVNLTTSYSSDLLREWRSQMAIFGAYHKTCKTLQSIMGQRHSARAIEDDVERDSDLAADFCDQRPAPAPSLEASVLVVQADGKGVPMVANADGRKVPSVVRTAGKGVPTIANADGRKVPSVVRTAGKDVPMAARAQSKEAPSAVQEHGKQRVRLGKGEKNGRKKEAIATGVYTIEPCVRTPQQVVDSLFKSQAPGEQEAPDTSAAKERKGPSNKQLWATFKGKSAAVALAKKQAMKRDGEHIKDRIALTDGAAALQNQIIKQLPDYALILDIIHAVEYLWKAANALYGETSLKREGWMKVQALLMLSGNTQQIIDELRKLAGASGRNKRVSKVLLGVAGYFQRNLPYMRYNFYLAKGWPIGTGVIEGACRHLIKDRCELSGMKWTIPGAEAILRLRSIAENGDWERFETFRQAQRSRDLYDNIQWPNRRKTITRAATEATMVMKESKAA